MISARRAALAIGLLLLVAIAGQDLLPETTEEQCMGHGVNYMRNIETGQCRIVWDGCGCQIPDRFEQDPTCQPENRSRREAMRPPVCE